MCFSSTVKTTSSTPSVSSSVSDWAANLPKIYETEMQYAPQEAALQVQLAQQYALPLAQAYKTAQDTLYPNETALTNQLTQQVQEGMGGEMPSWAKESYMDTMRAQLGDNAVAGVGADYMSRGLLQQQQDWKNYYQNLALSISGKQPVYTSQINSSPSYTNYASSFSPSGVMGYNSTNTTSTQSSTPTFWQGLSSAGNLLYGLGNFKSSMGN